MKIYYVDTTWDYGDGVENEVSKKFYKDYDLAKQEFNSILEDTKNDWDNAYDNYIKYENDGYFRFDDENHEDYIECAVIEKEVI